MTHNSERVFVSQNDQLFDLIKSDLSQFNEPFRKLATAFSGLGRGGLTAEVFNDIKAGREEVYVREYRQALEQELDDTKVLHKTLRSNLLQGTEEAVNNFLNSVEELRSFKAKKRGYGREEHQVLSIDFISVENGCIVITEQDEEAILETFCRHYLTTDEEKEVYASVDAICKGFEELEATCKRFNIPFSLTGSFAYADQFVTKTNGQVKPNAARIVDNLRMSKLAASY